MVAALNGNNFCSKEYKLPPHNADAIAACIIHVSLNHQHYVGKQLAKENIAEHNLILSYSQ